ncbi:MAG: dipeptidase [Acutalibacteraceae bacterium]|nr:membrane dipeptidase [Oscillospiraceae bacterium]
MKYFDLHCDSLTKCFNSGDELHSNANHVSAKKAECFEKWSQFFAVFIPDGFSDGYARTYFKKCAVFFEEQTADEKVDAYLTVENCGFIENPDDIMLLKSKNTVAASLTWNGDNKLACGSGTENDTGLTALGAETVRRLEKENILIDVSHASRKTFRDIAKLAERPIIASHSNSDEIRRSKRNLKDDQIKYIIENGGLIGLNFSRNFLPLDRPLFEGIYENVKHIVSMGGENNICFGGDFDGCFIPPCLDGIEKVPELFAYLRHRGLKNGLLDKIFYDNAQNFADKYLQRA